jgi:S-DNA-T family DNA segregation ATPase FtsK/SpoIIIE
VRIVLQGDDSNRELHVVANAPDATLADLLDAAGVRATEVVTVGDRVIATDHTLVESGIPDGSLIRPGRHVGPAAVLQTVHHRVPRLTVVAGAAAGDVVELRGPVTVGRDIGCGLVLASTTVSGQHVRVATDGRGTVTVTDLGSRNGTWVDGVSVATRNGMQVSVGTVIRCGAVVLRIEPPVDDDRPRSLELLRHRAVAGAVPFNRPPRPGAPPPTPPVRALPTAAKKQDRPVFSIAALLAPLVMAGVMVLIMGSIRFALFALLSPVMLLVNTVSGRRRASSLDRTNAAAHRVETTRFASEVRDSATSETARRWELLPSIAEVLQRAEQPSSRLWERRAQHADQLVLCAGVGPVAFTPALRTANGQAAETTPDATKVLEAFDRLPDAPVDVDLSRGGVVGIVGARGAAVGLARSLLVQACIHHGPADLPIAIVVDEARLGDWGWTTWLPHARRLEGGGDRMRLAVAGEQGEALLRGLLDTARGSETASSGLAGMAARQRPSPPGDDAVRPAGPTMLVVLDAPSHLRGRDAAARAVLRGDAGAVAGIVLARTADDLPAVCDTVITLESEDGTATLVRPADRTGVPRMLVAAIGADTARRAARQLAGIEDPELPGGAGLLPARVHLLDLLGRDAATPAGITRRWLRSAGSPQLSAPVGVGADGVVELDLVRDGPHGLLGGTTGSGKSELLRTLVVGLAAQHDPDHLTFVLVDYKGGAAFDVCAELPHVVGLVTDLDEHLGARALRCLEAELAHRERRLRACGVSDLPQWLRLPRQQRGEPLPRLLVVVDEFATLKSELPDFISALVGIAQRGRSLGVHMLLGTQRPSGAVDEDVRANSNLRIALRVTDTQDSNDVVGAPDAAYIAPSLPGRGVMRVGPGAVLPLQTALVTGRSGATGPRVRVGPVRFGPTVTVPSGEADDADDRGPSDLDRLVDACRSAFAAGNHPAPRRPWPEPLPADLPLATLLQRLPLDGGGLAIALVDLPQEQAQRVSGWALDAGNLLVHGVVGAGTTTTAMSCVLAAASVHSPDSLHIQVLDLGRGELQVLDGLPHVGAVVAGRETERRRRLLQHWFAEADRRRAMDRAMLDGCPRLLVVIDGLESLLSELDDPSSYDVADALLRFLVDAPGLRISVVLTTNRAGGLRSSLTSTIEQRWTHRLADPADYGLLGLRPADVPTLGPGRVVRTSDGREMQVARASDPAAMVAALAQRWGQPAVAPAQIHTLPNAVELSELVAGLAVDGRAWCVPIGRCESDLSLASLVLHAGEHAVLFGGPGSGRTGVLGAIAELGSRSKELDVVVCAGSATSRLLLDGHRVVGPCELGAVLAECKAGLRPTLVVVDDADRVPDPGAALEALARDGTRVHLIVAARADAVQADFGHWARRIARARVGGFLRPVGDVAGDLLGARLPRRTPAKVAPGRGWLVCGGELDFVQLASLGR